MKRPLIGLAALALAALSLHIAAPARAETIYLRSGGKISGKILEDRPEAIKVQVNVDAGGTAVMTIRRDRIDRIEKATTFDERLKVAQRFIDDNDGAGAEPRFRELVREQPRHAAARIGLSRALTKLGRDAEALKTMESYMVLAQDKRDPRALLYYAELLMYRGEHRDARKWAKDASALEPGNAKLKEQSDALLKRIERYRDGTEAAEARINASKAEAEARIKARAAWDKSAGTNLEAQEMGNLIRDWTHQTEFGLIEAVNLRLIAADRAEGNFARGGEAADYQKAVERVEMLVQVVESSWLRNYDHLKKVIAYGWYHQLRERYPNTLPVIIVQKVEKDKRDQPVTTELARASWDGRRDELHLDLRTPLNPDPHRPRVPPRPK